MTVEKCGESGYHVVCCEFQGLYLFNADQVLKLANELKHFAFLRKVVVRGERREMAKLRLALPHYDVVKEP